METIQNKQKSDIFPWIEVDTHPFGGTTNLIGIDVPFLRFYKMPESKTGHSGYFILIDHRTFENNLIVKDGSLYKDDILAIERRINESNFFIMERVYEETIFDGGRQTITIRDDEGSYKTVSLLRSTGMQSEKKIPKEFLDLHRWLIEFANNHKRFFNAFKLQFLGNDESKLDFVESHLKRCRALLRPERTGVVLTEVPPLRDHTSLKALIGIGFAVKDPEIHLSVYIFEDSGRHKEAMVRLMHDRPKEGRWHSITSTNGPMLFFGCIRVDEPNFTETKSLLSKISSAFAGDE